MKYQHLTNLTPNHQTFICLCLLLLPLLMASYNDAYAETEEVTKKVHPSPSHQMAPLYLGFGWGLRWPDGRVPVIYNSANVPPQFADQDKAVAIIKESLAKWENVCGIHFDFLGVTDDALENYEDNRVVIGWEVLEGAVGQTYPYSDDTNSRIKQLGYQPYIDGWIKIDSTGWEGATSFRGVLVHELGHLIGLGHSDNPFAFLYADEVDDYWAPIYPTADEIEGALALYGPPNNFSGTQLFSPPPFSTTASITNDFFYISSSWDNTNNHVSNITDTTIISDDDELYLQFDYNNFPLGEINFITLDPLGHIYNEYPTTLKYSSSGERWREWIGSAKPIKKFPGTWRVYAVSGNQTLFTRSLEVNTTPIQWNRPPEATLFITQAPTDNPLAILATVYAHDPEGNNTSIVWHIPEEGESKADFKDQISKNITFSGPGTYTLYVEINDDAPLYDAAGSGFRVLKSKTITVPLPPPNTIATLPSGEAKPSLSHFTGGIAINGGERQPSVTLNLADSVEVSGNLTIDVSHVGQIADLVVYAAYQLTPTDPESYYYMLGISDPSITPWYTAPAVLWWDQNPGNLAAVQTGVTLPSELPLTMYQGHFIAPGHLKVYFGYRLPDGTLVVNAQPIEITID